MTILHLGVLDVPYDLRRRRHDRRRSTGVSTGDVAQYLENKYGIMSKFWETRRKDYVDQIIAGTIDAVEARLSGRSPRVNINSVLERMRSDFRRFISERGVERVGIKGVPTQAALRGISHRLKRPYARGNPRRPSFRDTGLYEASFRAWIDR